MENNKVTFSEFLKTAFEGGIYRTDDVIAFVRPLFEEVLSFHEDGLVAPFEWPDKIFITDQRLDIDENYAHKITQNLKGLEALQKSEESLALLVVDQLKMETDVESGVQKIEALNIHLDNHSAPDRPAYIKGYKCYEMLSMHHDELTDIFCLGLILGSVALGLDLNEDDDVRLFGKYISREHNINDDLHPALHALIREMTELNRKKRSQDLYSILQRLDNYRDFDPENLTDLSTVAGWKNQDLNSRSKFVLRKLRNRLFDNSRRNRMMYYKPNMRFVNFTVSSVPVVLNYQSIRPEHLFTWNEEIARLISYGKDIVLNKYLRFTDHPYLSASLDKVRTEARRDMQEFGFSQLRLSIAFLNWNNFKENSYERIQSPLLLLPVEIVKSKKIREDVFTLKIKDNTAEVNPVLANFMRDKFGIQLPDFVKLDEMDLQHFYNLIREQVEASNQGITLSYVDKPRIKLIQSIARNTVNVFNRKLRRNNTNLSSYKDLDYSYQTESYKPLGLEIFKKRIQSQVSYLEFLVNADISHSASNLKEEKVTEKSLYEWVETNNPYHWEFDLCNIIIGNFNYKKMSLVRDYNQIIDNSVTSSVFDDLFNDAPREIFTEKNIESAGNVDGWNHVIEADPTQNKAIEKSRESKSYVIQGPPGTGKSQTITNLIADFVARGKRVLFICEKRAALDVVYFRLKQQGLDELCCYIHDSQSDKKEFIQDLKLNYEKFIKSGVKLSELESSRNKILSELQTALEALQSYHQIQNSVFETIGEQTHAFLEQFAQLKSSLTEISKAEKENIPTYNLWKQFAERISQLFSAIGELTGEDYLAGHAFSYLSDEALQQEKIIQYVESGLSELKKKLNPVIEKLNAGTLQELEEKSSGEILKLAGMASQLFYLANHDLLDLLKPTSALKQKLDGFLKKLKSLEADLAREAKNNANWNRKLTRDENAIALTIAGKYEKSFWKFLSKDWRKLKATMLQSYQFEQHQVAPSILILLQNLEREYAKAEAVQVFAQEKGAEMGVEDMRELLANLDSIQQIQGLTAESWLWQESESKDRIMLLADLDSNLQETTLAAEKIINRTAHKTFLELADIADTMQAQLDALPDILPTLKELLPMPADLKNMLREMPLNISETEALMAQRSLDWLYAQNKQFAGTGVAEIEKYIEQLKSAYRGLLKVNADIQRARVRHGFLRNMELSNIVNSQLTLDQRKFKKDYSEGRKILENEFSKSMRYKSIRELASSESGMVLRDLKLIWLMSPLSVSDSIPLNTSLFDVVIFDEASQITLEEGIPALYRAPQAIVVGDDKQMPPTNFFTSQVEDPDDLNEESLDGTDEILSNDADSLLAQASRRLDEVMLGWHYRSRYETLISFSNHAFYKAGLLTIPDRLNHGKPLPEIVVENPEEIADNGKELLQRSMSFHHMPNAVYEKRSNLSEARYIANLVRNLLKQEIKESIGIVAFSQEQQNTIENALSALAAEDAEFDKLLEEAYSRTEDEQYVGLFVKNLENVQGDERDIIIMSVCYGFDARKRMIMNFGPINKKGGEKRLNVIFSRAKKHMAIISSIKYQQITNEYNEGANYFKRFLQYAELVSTGRMEHAMNVLNSMISEKNEAQAQKRMHIVAQQLKEVLEKNGYFVNNHLGQSTFKCTLAIKKSAEDQEFSLGILVDDETHYQNENIIEQYFQRPQILNNFGWQIARVFCKDWIENPDKVLQKLLGIIRNENKTESSQIVNEHNFTSVFTNEIGNAQNVSDSLSVDSHSPYKHLQFERVEFTDEKSNKFWEVAIDENKLVIKYGKIGTKGQLQLKTFTNPEKAASEMQKLLTEKRNKGYR